MARVNIDILGISELKWAGISDFNSAAATAKSLQSCPTLCDPTDGSPPGSSIPGILQARTSIIFTTVSKNPLEEME